MKKIFATLIFTTVFVFTAYSADAAEAGTYIVMLEEGAQHEEILRDAEILDTFEKINGYLVKVDAEQISILRQQKEVSVIQKEHIYNVSSQITPPAFESMQLTPEVRSAYSGKGVKIGIIDTGIDHDHPDLNIAGGVCTLFSDCPINVPYNDDNYHGTHVAGIIGAQDNGIGSVGVAPDAEIYAIKALNFSGGGRTSSIINGIDWAIKNEMDIINLSITNSSDDIALASILNEAYNQGILIVGAAGNTGSATTALAQGTASSVQFPARYETVIAVGAVDASLKRIPMSSTGPEVEVVAQGNKIYSTVPEHEGLYHEETGTSMAAPYVTGLLAMYKERFPEASHLQLRNILNNSTKDLGVGGRDNLYGNGLAVYSENPVQKPEYVFHSSGNGVVTFDATFFEKMTNVKVIRNGNEIYNGEPIEKFEDYVPKGTYDYKIDWTLEDGTVKSKTFSVLLTTPYFKDLSVSQWFAPHMTYLYNRSIISGYTDQTIRPYTNIKRGEAVALLGRAIGLNGEKRSTRFTDLGYQHFASGYVQSAYENGLLAGFPDGTFRPDQYVTRAEMAILIANAYSLGTEPENQFPFQDVTDNVTGHYEVAALYHHNITRGVTNTTYKPYDYISRSAFSVFLARAESDQFKD
ncbi:S8 family serine peptidase [Jeotgalibacillus sp. JSM ZJ347]|uniref:S8 family peptidase n=1 Tax=Jeotgalibacillus sp. JSM ZJ347 TaxID=3342117 RepID=UPI0035A8B05B